MVKKNHIELKSIRSFEVFSRYYWYRKDLSDICKQLGIEYVGTKQELNSYIKEYFNGNLIAHRTGKESEPNAIKVPLHQISLATPLLDCGFAFNASFRKLFSDYTGKAHFKFTADMATAWRKVKREHDHSFTLQDMLDIYNGCSSYAHYDHSSCQWNQFLKDFCADSRNAVFTNKLKVASILWKQVRDSFHPKVYNYNLVLRYWDIIEKFL